MGQKYKKLITKNDGSTKSKSIKRFFFFFSKSRFPILLRNEQRDGIIGFWYDEVEVEVDITTIYS